MIEYYLCSRSQSTGAHVVHTNGCPMLNEEDICIGIFDEAGQAVLEGMKHFRKVKLCPFCLREEKREIYRGSCTGYKQMVPEWDSFMLCGIN